MVKKNWGDAVSLYEIGRINTTNPGGLNSTVTDPLNGASRSHLNRSLTNPPGMARPV